jgi:transglutaminase-like putative cysteine protease
MKFETYFRLSSFLMIACGAAALLLAGGLGMVVAIAFALVLVVAWKLEATRWQLPARAANALVLAALPLFALDWKFHILTGASTAEDNPNFSIRIGTLIYFTLFLSSIKLLQKKSDRDWFFLYLISFFEILLSASLSINPQFFGALLIYTLCALSTVIAFEMRKAKRRAREHLGATRILNAAADDLQTARRRRLLFLFARRNARRSVDVQREARRLPFVAAGLLLLIFSAALPIFFLVPRYGAGAFARTNGSTINASIGFSDEVTLGDIGRLQQSDNVVMRVKVENPSGAWAKELKWRGVALDYFNGHAWRRSTSLREVLPLIKGNYYQLDATIDRSQLVTQTFYLEPLDTGALFAAPRAVALQAALPSLARDRSNSLETDAHPQEHLTYRVYSDTSEPAPELLRRDTTVYTGAALRDLQFPSNLDPRIGGLAHQIIVESHATNRYDAARAIENYLRTNYGYSLEMRASGDDPLADFLFRVRAGHCEYFSTAMAVMLRTQGIAARVVNGFQTGEYNDAADIYTVRQRDAHSWVEVYFPSANAWVTFDPTPASDPANERARATGLLASLNKWREAFEAFWIQYVVTYDRAQQQSLAQKINTRFGNLRRGALKILDHWRARFNDLWSGLARTETNQARGGKYDYMASAKLFWFIGGALLFGFIAWRARSWKLWRRIFRRRASDDARAAIEFYERMTQILKSRGVARLPYQTPAEFAASVGAPEVLKITNAYTRVRYGDGNLSKEDAARIEEDLKRLAISK